MLKSVDFFRKIQNDQELSSSTGGLFTIIALLAAALLILYSIQDFYKEQYQTFLTVQNDDSEYLPMNLDMYFDKMPCNAISIQFFDQMEYSQSHLQKKLTLYNVPKGQEEGDVYKKKEDYNQEMMSFQSNAEKQFGCRLKGTLPLPKTPGTLVFKPSGNNNIIFTINSKVTENLRMRFRINKLQFGSQSNKFDFPIAHKSKNIQNYVKQLQGDISTRTFVHNQLGQSRQVDYFNHIKIIPIIIEETKGVKKHSEKYRYSLRSGKNENSNEPFDAVTFMTEIQPINIIYRKHEPKFYDLIIEILAIVGGTVATLGIFNSISHFLFGIK